MKYDTEVYSKVWRF